MLIAITTVDDGRDGVQAVTAINARRTEPLPALMVTANYGNNLKQHLYKLGHTLLHKPVKPMKLKTTLSHWLQKPRAQARR